MRLAIISDIHANLVALEAVLADIASRQADRLFCLGDIVLKGPQPRECVQRIRELGCPTVLGNCDAMFAPAYDPTQFPPQNRTQEALAHDYERCLELLSTEERQWLSSRPFSHTETIRGERFDFFHSSPEHIYKLVWPWAPESELGAQCPSAETAVAVYGHIHRPFIRWVSGGRMVINAGSVGLPFDHDCRASYVLLELSHTGATAAQIVRVPYDYEEAVRIATITQMPGADLFAYTVRTGRFAG